MIGVRGPWQRSSCHPHPNTLLMAPAARSQSKLCEGSHMMRKSDRLFFGLIMGGMVSLLALVGLLTVLHQFIPA